MKLGVKLPRGVLLAGPPEQERHCWHVLWLEKLTWHFFRFLLVSWWRFLLGLGLRVLQIFSRRRDKVLRRLFSSMRLMLSEGNLEGRTLNCKRDQTLNQLLTEMD